ncbi:hypothetical protein, partial [Escherichia coli]|uniref:hypothetical protein n=1 Tax=Escherichia coli TaxID=562 RepID=UPI00201EA2F8
SGAPGCVTWELILDGYSESSYSATPRFAAARLPWFISFQAIITGLWQSPLSPADSSRQTSTGSLPSVQLME